MERGKIQLMWERILTYEIQPEDAGRTVAEYLRSRGFSRHLLIRLKTMPDGITLDGVPVLPSHRFFFDRVKSHGFLRQGCPQGAGDP